MIPPLKDVLKKARSEAWAVPHINISTLEMMRAVVEAALQHRSPLLIGTSEGERDFVGLRELVMLTRSFRDLYQFPIYLNADHTRSVKKAKEAIDAGYDSIHIDLSKEPYDANLAGTKEVVSYARSKNEAISVEGEIGYLVTDSSKIYDSIVEVPEESLADPDSAKEYVQETGVDRLAPAVGSLHGIAANEPHLDIARIKKMKDLMPDTALVLHGGSGVTEHDLKTAIQSGVSNVHISTDVRKAFARELKKSLSSGEIAPYKFLRPSMDAVKKVVAHNIELFGSAHKV